MITEPTAARGVPYDLDRAARVGGFEQNLEDGREIARRLHSVMAARMPLGADAKAIVESTIHEIADLWDGDPGENPLWLAAMSNSVHAMLRDLSEQISEARGVRRPSGRQS